MFDWLFEGRISVYIVLGTVAVLMIILWRQHRNRRLLHVAAGAIALMGVYWLLSRQFETDRTRIERTLIKMTDAVGQNKLDVSFACISEQFRSPMGKTKHEFRKLAEDERARGRVTGVIVWDVMFPERPDPNREARVNFQFKLRGDLGGKEAAPYSCEAVFVHESDGVWRLLRCRLKNSFRDEEIDLNF